MLNKIIEKRAVLIYRRRNDSNKPTVEHYNTFDEAEESARAKGIMNNDWEYTLASYTKLFNRWILCKDGYSNDPFGEFTVGLYA